FVGIGVRDCGNSENPDSCYGSGEVQYSLDHDGPFLVRNYDGEEYSAPIFRGRIEHAPMLAADRRFTDPVSGSDMALISGDIQRTEFRGRPLAGAYHLRVWDNEALQWDRVEDIQLVLHYTYWTHDVR